MSRLSLLSTHVPRYTSYPTAPHFHSGIDAGTYRDWLGDLSDAESLSLYVHIPFCDTLCWFCGCHMRVVNTYSPVKSYLEVLSREIDLAADALCTNARVRHIHWGGGSPTMLTPDDIQRVTEQLWSRFSVASDAECAIEIDPRGLKDETIAALAEAGFTRASIGVQDSDPDVQRAINRIQPFSVTASAAVRLRVAGIRQLNFDVMYGLPHQTVAHVERTIENVLSLNPDRLAVFGYAHVPGFKKHQNLIPEAALPNAEQRFEQFEAASALLTANGYVAIGLDHFARSSDPMSHALHNRTLRRNFQGYTTDTANALLGFGASAIGALPQGYVQNITDAPAYRDAVQAGRLPIARGVALTSDDRVRRDIIEELMCYLRVDVAVVAQRYGARLDRFAQAFDALSPLVQEGLAKVDGTVVEINPMARAAVRVACAAFDAYLQPESGKHAIAV